MHIRQKSKTVRGGRTSKLGDRQEWNNIPIDELHYRKLTVKECERLQTVPDGYTSSVSKTQAYKMLGNGWTVDVIAHIFGYLDASMNTTDRGSEPRKAEQGGLDV